MRFGWRSDFSPSPVANDAYRATRCFAERLSSCKLYCTAEPQGVTRPGGCAAGSLQPVNAGRRSRKAKVALRPGEDSNTMNPRARKGRRREEQNVREVLAELHCTVEMECRTKTGALREMLILCTIWMLSSERLQIFRRCATLPELTAEVTVMNELAQGLLAFATCRAWTLANREPLPSQQQCLTSPS